MKSMVVPLITSLQINAEQQLSLEQVAKTYTTVEGFIIFMTAALLKENIFLPCHHNLEWSDFTPHSQSHCILTLIFTHTRDQQSVT